MYYYYCKKLQLLLNRVVYSCIYLSDMLIEVPVLEDENKKTNYIYIYIHIFTTNNHYYSTVCRNTKLLYCLIR
jgi:hypothetical protein